METHTHPIVWKAWAVMGHKYTHRSHMEEWNRWETQLGETTETVWPPQQYNTDILLFRPRFHMVFMRQDGVGQERQQSH